MKPAEIEQLSFKIIDKEAGPHHFSDQEWKIVRRMIHTTADFEYMKSVRFHPKAVECGIMAIKNAQTIVTDTNMALSGIRKNDLADRNTGVQCLINDPQVIKSARQEGTTRAHAAVSQAMKTIDNGIYVIGNAPTALLRLVELVQQKKLSPSLIIGLPVGFVNAAESKNELIGLDIPYITNVGRKGGSNVAAAVVNAIIIMAGK